MAMYGLSKSISRDHHWNATLLGTVPWNSDFNVLGRLYPRTLKIIPVRTLGSNNGIIDAVTSNIHYPAIVSNTQFDLAHFGILPGVRGGVLAKLARSRGCSMLLSVPDFPPYEALSYSDNLVSGIASVAQKSAFPTTVEHFG